MCAQSDASTGAQSDASTGFAWLSSVNSQELSIDLLEAALPEQETRLKSGWTVQKKKQMLMDTLQFRICRYCRSLF